MENPTVNFRFDASSVPTMQSALAVVEQFYPDHAESLNLRCIKSIRPQKDIDIILKDHPLRLNIFAPNLLLDKEKSGFIAQSRG